MDNIDKELYKLVNNNCLDGARKIAYNYIGQYQDNEQFVILFILFKINDIEIASGEDSIFASPAAGTVDSLIKHYTRIKFYLRRFEYGMPEESLNEAFNYFIENKVSINALCKIAEFACINKKNVYKKLALFYKNNGMPIQAKILEYV